MMRINGIEIESFRKFAAPVSIAGFAQGINVLEGPNETGKSTVLAALREAIFTRHRSTAAETHALRPWGCLTAPRVRVRFAIGAQDCLLEKRFLQAPFARLATGDGMFEGAEAEDALQRLLGFSAPSHGSPDFGIWDLLHVQQRRAGATPAMAGRALQSVHDCLQDAIGALGGGRVGEAILARVAARRSEHVSDLRDAPRNRYRSVLAEHAEAMRELESLQETRARIERDLDDLATVQAALAAHDWDALDASDAAALDALARRRDEALRRAAEAVSAGARLDAAERAAASARVAAEGRRRQILAVAEGARRTSELRAGAAAAAQLLTEATDAAAKADAAAAVAVGAADRATSAYRAARAIHEIALRRDDAATARARAAEARHAEEAAAALRAEMQALAIDAASIKAIREAARAVETARAQVGALAAVLTVELRPEAAGRVRIGGAAADDGAVQITAETAIEVDGIGRFLIRPAAADAADLAVALAAAEERLASLLASAGCADAAAAEVAWERKQQLRGDAEAALARARGLAGNGGASGLEERSRALDEALRRDMTEAGLVIVPPTESAALAAGAAQDALAPIESAAAAACAATERARAVVIQRERDWTSADAAFNAEAAQQGRREEDLRGAESVADEAELIRRSDHADAERAQARDALSAARGGEAVEEVDALIAALEGGRATRRDERQRLGVRRSELRASIARAGADGVDERLDEAQSRAMRLARERDAIGDEVAALSLLREVLTEERNRLRGDCGPALAARIAPMLRRVLPGADPAVGGDLSVRGLIRRGTEERLGDLSDGTQEQVSILTRIALADLLIERGKPAMLIIDDGLVYADVERRGRMLDVLAEAGERMQVLVLTCRPDIFAPLPGTRLRIEEMAEAA